MQRAYLDTTDYKFPQATFELNLNVKLVFQPPNSLDLNVLDLGYFNSTQSLQYHSDSQNIQELVEVVRTSFNTLHCKKLNDTFLMLQKLTETIILCDRNSNIILPHICKRKSESAGQLPLSIKVVDFIKEEL